MSTVLVVGAGYAGAQAAVAARRRGADVLLLDPTGQHELLARLAAVAGGRVATGDGWAPADELLGVTVRRVAVAQVLTDRPAVRLTTGEVVEGDAVVLAAGAVASTPDIPGLADHALPLRTVADALAIRRELVDTTRLVVVGAGPTGVQLAHEAAGRHRHLTVSLVEGDTTVLPGFHAALGRRAEHLLWDAGVEVSLGESVRRFHDDGVELASGRVVEGRPVWAGGFTAVGNDLLPDAETEDGRLVVTQTLRVPGTVGVFAAGDVAAHRDVLGRPVAMSAQIADQAGSQAGRNAVRHANDEPLAPALLYDLGWVMAMDGRVGVAEIGPLRIAAPLLDRLTPALHAFVDLKHLYEVGGLSGMLTHSPGRHRPDRAQVLRVERPALRGVS